MKNYLFKFSTLIFCFFLVACNQIATLVDEFAISEAMMNRYLERYLGEEQSVDIAGLAKASLAFNNLSVGIAQEDADKVAVSGGVNFAIATLLGKPSAGFDIRVKARPVYDAQKGAIYLKDLELNDFALNSSVGSAQADALLPYLNKALQLYFNERPVYELDSQASLLKNIITGIEVKQGKIKFLVVK